MASPALAEPAGVVALPYRQASPAGGVVAEAPPEVLFAAAAAMEEGVRQAARGTQALWPVSSEEMAIRLARVAYSPNAEEDRKTAREKLSAAEKAYFALDLALARRLLAEAMNAASRTPQTPEDLSLLSDLRLLEGMIALPTDPAGAGALFDSVALLSPERTLDPRRYPPPVVTALARAVERRRSTAAVGQLDVQSDPAEATVAVDGVVRGRTPLSLDRLVAGEHFYRLEKAYVKPLFGTFTAAAGENPALTKTLEKVKPEDLSAPVTKAAGGAPGDLPALFGAERALLASIAPDGPRRYSVTEWWVEPSGARSAGKTRTLSAEPSLFAGGMVTLTREVLSDPPADAAAVRLPEVAPLAHDLALLASGSALGELKRPPPPLWARWQFKAGVAGAVALGLLTFVAIESGQPAHVNYDVTVPNP